LARPETAVVDASVATKWYLPEADTDAAISLRQRHVSGDIRLVSPDLMVYEVANALRYHPRAGIDRLAEHIGDLFALEIGFDRTSETSMIAAIHSAFRLGLSIYDASYISLAERLDTVVYTADEALYRAAGTRGRRIRSASSSR
jgi:predicted nucleic acid-binding protein